jgi:hypothetical protein
MCGGGGAGGGGKVISLLQTCKREPPKLRNVQIAVNSFISVDQCSSDQWP